MGWLGDRRTHRCWQMLIVLLCTCAGLIIEDAHYLALVAGASSAVVDRVSRIAAAGHDVEALANAAAVVARRWPEPAM